MKLLDKYNRLNITATIITFVIGSCTFYFLLHYILIHQIDETLMSEQQEIVAFANTHHSLPDIIRTKDQYTNYETFNGNTATSFQNVRSGEKEEMRQIQFGVSTTDGNYLVKVAKPLEETEDLLQVIIGVTIGMIALILLVGYFINRIVIKKIWRPFYRTIEEVKSYRLTDETLRLEQSEIDEFTLLNQSISELTERVQRDYTSLKNLTGQAAHEMQTPLAIIRTKLDLLMQNEEVLRKHAQHIADMEQAVQRSARLQQSLLLLTKVENRQFALDEPVQADAIIRQKLAEFSELAEAMHLRVAINDEPTLVQFHHHLAEIIISNLLNNAIRYNAPNGKINIELKNGILTIGNTSTQEPLDQEKVFKRFYRVHQGEDGNGLGLSIVKQICEAAGYTASYNYVQGLHTFTINFKPAKF